MLWEELRGSKQQGNKFRRQHPLGRHILDFVCVEHKLVVELDGAHHALEEEYRADRERTEHLEQYGYRVLRFSNEAIISDIDSVLERIRVELDRCD